MPPEPGVSPRNGYARLASSCWIRGASAISGTLTSPNTSSTVEAAVKHRGRGLDGASKEDAGTGLPAPWKPGGTLPARMPAMPPGLTLWHQAAESRCSGRPGRQTRPRVPSPAAALHPRDGKRRRRPG